MADPSGPTVAEGPEEQDATSTDRSAEARSPSSDAPKPTDPAPEGVPPGHAVEGTPPTADDTGTVDPGPDAATTTPVDAGPKAATTTPVDGGPEAATTTPADTTQDGSTTTERWPAAAVPEVGSAELPSGKSTGATDTDTDTGPDASDDVAQEADSGVDDEDGEVDGDGDGDGDGEAGAKGGLLDKKVQLDAKVLLLVLGFLALAVGAYFLGQRQAKDDDATAAPRTTAATTFVQPTEYVPFVDEQTGIKLSIPKEWTRRSTKNLGPEARLLAEVPNTQDTLLVRANSYSKEVTAANLNDQKALIDTLFAEEKQLTILGVESGDLKGMPVLVYVYRFPDPSGAMGIHAHYFVFQGRKAVQMVFQALPEDHYTTGGLGVVWGRISESLEVTPGPPPAFLEELGSPATTAPGAPPAPGATTAPPPSAPPPTG